MILIDTSVWIQVFKDIAQIAIENELLLLHNDKDFGVIHQIRPLIHHRWQ